MDSNTYLIRRKLEKYLDNGEWMIFYKNEMAWMQSLVCRVLVYTWLQYFEIVYSNHRLNYSPHLLGDFRITLFNTYIRGQQVIDGATIALLYISTIQFTEINNTTQQQVVYIGTRYLYYNIPFYFLSTITSIYIALLTLEFELRFCIT